MSKDLRKTIMHQSKLRYIANKNNNMKNEVTLWSNEV